MSPLADTIAANSGGRRCKEKRKVGHTQRVFKTDVALYRPVLACANLRCMVNELYFRLKYGHGECILILNFSAAICWFSEK